MPENLEAQVVFANVSGVPRDQYVNTFQFRSQGDFGDTAVLADAIQGFYNVENGNGFALAAMLSGRISRAANATAVKFYNVDAAPPRVPIYSEQFTLHAAGTVQVLPEEVALCLSFRGPLASGTVAARRRGRIYLGPLCKYAAESTVGSEDRPEPDNFAPILAKMAILKSDAAIAGYDWGVRSSIGGGFTTITHAWIDNVFDTQRRRGPRATARTTLDIP